MVSLQNAVAQVDAVVDVQVTGLAPADSGRLLMRRDLLRLKAAHLENEQKLLREKNIMEDV